MLEEKGAILNIIGGRVMYEKTEEISKSHYMRECETVREWLHELERGPILEAVNEGCFTADVIVPAVRFSTLQEVVKQHGYKVVTINSQCMISWIHHYGE